MKMILLGSRGQLGTELQRLLPQAVAFSRAEFDITCEDHLAEKLDPHQPEWIINCAAYNQVDRAEQDSLAAFQGNALGPRALANYCRDRQCRLVQISTDYVFGGERLPARPRVESDTPLPVSVYGTSKLAGEHFVLAAGDQNLVIRTCGLYGLGGQGNFVRTMLRLAREGRSLRVVDDQFCSPTSVRDLAAAILTLIEQDARGLYHVVNRGEISWYEFARLIFNFTNTSADLQPIGSAEYGSAARRPAYSVLNCERYEKQTGRSLPPIETALHQFLNELKTV